MEITQESIDKIIEEIREINAIAIKRMEHGALDQLKLVKEHYEEKIQDLTRQNEGLLGAVGRLQAERDAAIKNHEDQKAKERQREQDFRIQARDLERHVEEAQADTRQEIDGYKKQIAELQAKLKKQTKK